MQKFDDYNFSGKRVLIRVDFNVPLNENLEVTDDTRIRAAIPTIKKVIKDGGKAILMSHMGRPTEAKEAKFSLKNTIPTIENLLGKPVTFAGDCIGDDVKALVENMTKGTVVLLENLRYYKEEKAGDEFFAGQLAELADVYVNDAFGAAHRAHASTSVITKFFPHDKLFGYIMEDEIKYMDRVLYNSEEPVTAIVGGAKVSSKISIIENLIEKVNYLVIGGGMAFTFIRAQGGKTGNSLVEDDKLDMALRIIELARRNNVELFIPSDAIIADAFSNDANVKECASDQIPSGWMGLDIGSKSVKAVNDILRKSKTILWNGPMGVFEMEKFSKGTESVARTLAGVTQAGGVFSLVGGGDSVAAINKYKLADQVSYVSTGGGAMLEYLEGKTLPGIQAIKG